MARILLLDDDELFRTTLAQMLTACGHTVIAAADGLEGTRLFRAGPCELLITDLMMPHSGLATIRVLCSQHPELRVIAMSGGGTHRLDYARSLGARRTLVKPFTRQEINAAIAETLAPDSVKPEPPT